jgi:hypothetical protein
MGDFQEYRYPQPQPQCHNTSGASPQPEYYVAQGPHGVNHHISRTQMIINGEDQVNPQGQNPYVNNKGDNFSINHYVIENGVKVKVGKKARKGRKKNETGTANDTEK